MSFDPSTAAPEDGFDPTSAVPEDAPDTRTVLQTAVKANPEQAAKASKLAKKYDAPEDVLYRNLQNVELIDAVNRYDERLKTSPKLAAAMQRKPSLAQQAHDDIEPLAQIESNFAATTAASLASGVLSLSEGVWRIPDAAQRATGYLAGQVERTGLPKELNPVRGLQDLIRLVSEGSLPTGYKFGAGTTDVANSVKSATGLLSSDTSTFGSAFADNATMGQNADKALAAAIKDGNTQQLAQVVTNPQYWASFVSNSAPSLLAAIASGGSLQSTMLLEGLDAASSAADFEQRTGKKISDQDFTQAVAQSALVNGLLEKFGLDKVMGAEGRGLKGVLQAVFSEGGTEVLQQVNSNLATQISYDGGQSLTEGLLQSFMGGAGAGGGVNIAHSAATRLQQSVDDQGRKQAQAQASADQLQAQMQAAAQAKLRERNPDEFRELMSHMSDRSVYVDGDVLNQLAPEVRALLPQAVQEQIDIAAGTGDAVEIPVADVLTVAPGTPLEQMFVEHARTDPFAMSQAESKAAGEKAGEYLRTQSEEAIAAAADQEAFRASSEAVRQNILSQLNEAARYRPAVNEGMAQWAGAFYTTMASRLGMTPEQMHQQFPLRILSESRSAGQVMDQGGVIVTDQMDEVTGLPLNSDGTVTVYHHTSKANADAITKSGKLKAAAEPDVYVTTRKETDTGYGDTAVAIRVKPEQLQIDDEFPDGRVDYRINVGKPGGAAKVQVGEPAQQSDNLNQTATSLPPTIEIDGKQRPTTNSNGQPIAATEEGVRNFWAWFGDSKVVDAEGKPLVVYHGTRAQFEVFDFGRIGQQGRAEGAGFYFTTNKQIASGYGTPMEVYLAVDKPLPYDAKGFSPSVLQKIVKKVAENEASADGTDIADGFLSNFGDTYTNGVQAAVKEAARLISADETAIDQLSGIVGSGVGPEHVNAATTAVTGFDGVVSEGFSNSGDSDNRIFVAFNPTQIKSAIGNSGEFDPANPSILNQTATNGPRATFNPKTLELVLNPSADLSSFFHETGHFFLEVMSDIASQPDAPAQVQEDMGKLLSWFGVPDLQTWNTMTLDQQRPYHERFAESIEQYLMEGKAPSLELQPVMRRFRAWLLSVYKSLKAFVESKPNAEQMPLNDDIRRVMDRMLATDEQIAQANEVAGLVPDETADGEAAERLQKRSIADLKWAVKARDKALKALRAQAKTIEKGIREQVSQEVDATPEMQAKSALDKLRKAKELNDATRATVADAFGYANTDEMLQAIDAYGKRSEVIDALTERRMLEEHGDLIDERAVQEAANEAVHNEARARSLATELRTQSEMLNPRQDTGRVNSKGSKITVNALVEAAKQYGQNVADRTVLKDLKNKAWQHTAAERRASTRWKEATAKGDTQAAVKAKQDQMLNNAAAKAVIDAKNEAAKIFEFFKRVTKGDNETVVEKGRDADIVNAARAVLKAYGVETATTKKADAYLELVKRNDPDTYGIIFPMVDGAMREAQPLESLTVEQLRALNEDIEAIWYKAKQSRQMEIDGDLMDRQDIEDELKAQIQEVGVPDHMPGDTSAITPAEQRALKLKHYLATARRVESWAQGLDGSKKLGPFRKFIWQPIKEAADALRVDKAKYLKRYRDLLKGVESTLVKETIAAPELGYTFGKDTDGVAMVEVLHAILHTGNESNKRKLLLGRGWAIENQDGTLDTGKWDAFVARMIAEGKVTKAHYDFAQGVWDLLEDTKPLAQKAHRYVFGRYFAEVTADAFDTPFGQYQGGYVPAQADARIVSDAATRALAEAENNSMQFAFPTTNKGFTKSRVEYNRPLLLDLRALSQHIDKVLLFSHMEQPVRDVRKLLTAKGVAYGLNRVDPVAFDTILTPWLNRAAKQLVATPAPNNWQGWRFWSTLRNRAGMAAMFGNLANAVQQLAGFSMAAVKVKPKHLMGATAQFIANPKQVSEMVSSKSAYMDGRLANEVANMSDAINEILVNPNIYEKTKNFTAKHAYFVQSAVDSVMGPIIWSGAYNQALAEGFDDRDAVRLADSAVRETQGSTSPEDISAFEEGSPFTRLFTQFAGYFNMQANLLGTEFQVLAREMGLKKGAARGLYVLTFGFLVNAWAAEAIMQLFKGGPDDEDKDGEYLDDWLKQVFGWSLLRNTTAMVPLFGQAANALVNASNSKPYDDRMATSPAISMLEATAKAPVSVYKAVAEDGKASRAVRDVGTLIAMTVGIPLAPITKPLGYAADVAQGNVKPTSPVDAARGAVTGTASPESKR